MGEAAGETSVATIAADYLRTTCNKPGNVFVGIVSRLDRLVSGVLVLARTSKAASRLSEQFRQQSVEKIYLAWVEGSLESRGPIELGDWVTKDEACHRMRVVKAGSPGAQEAKLRYEVLERQRHKCLIRVELLTGRKHQIRLQLSHAGHPICGDKKYEAQTPFPRGIGLHCLQVSLAHPTRQERLTFRTPPPSYWPKPANAGG